MLSPETPASARAAWSLGTVSVGLALAAVAVHLVADVDVHDPRAVAGGWVVAPLVAVSMAVPGAVIAAHQPRDPVGWLFHLGGLVLAVSAVAYEYALVVHADGVGGTAGQWAVWASGRLGALSTITWPFVFLLTPTGRLPSQRWRPVAAAMAVLVAVCVAASLFWAGPVMPAGADVATSLRDVDNPVGLAGDLAQDAAVAGAVTSGAWLAALVIGSAALAIRWRTARGADRRRLAWVGSAAAVALPLSAGAVVAAQPLSGGLEVLGAGVLAAGLSVAMLRHGLFDVRPVLRRAMVYGLLTGLVVLTYVALVTGLTWLMPLGGDRRVIVSLAVTGLVAVGFAPVRDHVQHRVDRLVYGERATPYRALARLGTLLEETPAASEVLPAVVTAVADALRSPYVAIEVADLDGSGVLAAHGSAVTAGREPARIPLVSSGSTVGELVVAARDVGDRFDERDLALLRDLSRHVAGHVHAAVLMGQLRASRERLVSAREEERRRLRRDLHDGIGPSLASLALQLDAATRLQQEDPGRLTSLLGSMRDQVQSAVVEVRRVVDELRPSSVDDLGLEGALRAQLRTLTGSATTAELSVDGDLRALPAAVEVAAYRIVSEALANVVRHSSAADVLVRVVRSATRLELEVRDDGVGLPSPRRDGVGLTSLRERVEELGGRWRLDSEPGRGTRVAVWLPLTVPLPRAARLGVDA